MVTMAGATALAGLAPAYWALVPVAIAAGLGVGIIPDLKAASANWQQEREFAPEMQEADRDRLYAGWKTAIGRIRS